MELEQKLRLIETINQLSEEKTKLLSEIFGNEKAGKVSSKPKISISHMTPKGISTMNAVLDFVLLSPTGVDIAQVHEHLRGKGITRVHGTVNNLLMDLVTLKKGIRFEVIDQRKVFFPNDVMVDPSKPKTTEPKIRANKRRVLDFLKSATEPISSNELAILFGLKKKLVVDALYELKKAGLIMALTSTKPMKYALAKEEVEQPEEKEITTSYIPEKVSDYQ